MKSLFKNDNFKRARGGHSRMLEISCQKCGEVICNYQKDGPGALKRMYIDRIIEPRVSLDSKEFLCVCGHIIGSSMIYEKENRPAFRLFVESVKKKIVKGK